MSLDLILMLRNVLRLKYIRSYDAFKSSWLLPIRILRLTETMNKFLHFHLVRHPNFASRNWEQFQISFVNFVVHPFVVATGISETEKKSTKLIIYSFSVNGDLNPEQPRRFYCVFTADTKRSFWVTMLCRLSSTFGTFTSFLKNTGTSCVFSNQEHVESKSTVNIR